MDFAFYRQKYLTLQGSSIARGKIARLVCPAWSLWHILVLRSEKVHVFSLCPGDVHPILTAQLNLMQNKAYMYYVRIYMNM